MAYFEQPMGQRRIQVGNLKVPETDEYVNTAYRNMSVAISGGEGERSTLNTSLRKEGIHRVNKATITPQGTREENNSNPKSEGRILSNINQRTEKSIILSLLKI